ncbi:MAG: hypothetical protein IK142_01885 [Clostridiales bacterium]|nr:hypothetical protein [Clostridiales bacterium]
MSDDRSSHEVHVEGTQFYRRSAIADIFRIVLITVVVLVAVSVLAAWAIVDAGARQAHKEARDIRKALRIVGTEYYGELTSIYDPYSSNGMVDGAAEKIADISTRGGEVILYSWDDSSNAPLQFEYRNGLYRVIYTDTGVSEGYSAGVEGEFNVYYSFEILHFDAE